MNSSSSQALANLARIGQLKAEPPDARERAGLLRSASVRLHDARQVILSLESRFDLAYNAAHAPPCLHCVNMVIATITAIWSFKAWNTRWGSRHSSGCC